MASLHLQLQFIKGLAWPPSCTVGWVMATEANRCHLLYPRQAITRPWPASPIVGVTSLKQHQCIREERPANLFFTNLRLSLVSKVC